MAYLLGALALGGCSALSGSTTDRSYNLPQGIATYDAIKQATDDCTAKGGVLQLHPEADTQLLDSYSCKIAKPGIELDASGSAH